MEFRERKGKVVGYARSWSTKVKKDSILTQSNEIIKAGVEPVNIRIEEHACSYTAFENLLNELKKGDTLYVYSVFYLANTVGALYDLLQGFIYTKINFISMLEPCLNIGGETSENQYVMDLLDIIRRYEAYRYEKYRSDYIFEYMMDEVIRIFRGVRNECEIGIRRLKGYGLQEK